MVRSLRELTPHLAETPLDYYNRNASMLAEKYDSVSFEQVHASILSWLPTAPGNILDLGAGSGRDAAALVDRGHRVWAVEPSAEFRFLGRRLHPSEQIIWVGDALPELALTRRMGKFFDAVLCSAVWMHLSDSEQRRALQVIESLLMPAGRFFLSFRNGNAPDRPGLFDVDPESLLMMANERGFDLLNFQQMPDNFGRPELTWSSMVFEKRPLSCRRPTSRSTRSHFASKE